MTAAAVACNPQPMRALLRANDVRRTLAQLKDDLGKLDRRAGLLEGARLLGERPDEIGSLKIHAFLVALPRVGEAQAKRLLYRGDEHIWPLKRVSQMTTRQRMQIVGKLAVMASQVEPALKPDEVAILEFIALADGEGPTLAYNIAEHLEVSPRGMGARLNRLAQLQLVDRVVCRQSSTFRSDQLYGWVLLAAGREALQEEARR